MRNFKKVLITGITGSGGSYLSEHINNKKLNIKIFGTYRSVGYKKLIKEKIPNLKLFKVDLNNFPKVNKVLAYVKPDLIIHLASNANVRASFDKPRDIIQNNNIQILKS